MKGVSGMKKPKASSQDSLRQFEVNPVNEPVKVGKA